MRCGHCDLRIVATLAAFKQVVNNDVPTLSYLTILDAYLIGCIFFLFYAIG